MLGILYNEKNKIFHLQTDKTSYIMQVSKNGELTNVYYGGKVNDFNSVLFSTPNYDLLSSEVNLDSILREYPSYGKGDFRTPALEVQLKDGSTINELKYITHKIFKGKKELNGLPATYIENEEEATTLEVTLFDTYSNLELILIYTVFEEYNAITRCVKFKNKGSEELKLLKAMSAVIDFESSKYQLLQLSGAWCRERHLYKRKLAPGLQGIDSKRGISSHSQNPFIALLNSNATEETGEVYGFSLIYSGNFLAEVEVDFNLKSRVCIGINPFDFSWIIEAGEEFQTPEVVMVYSKNGLGEMSRTYHKLYRERLCRGYYKDRERPILVNNWEATYFNFNENKLKEIATAAAELGIELFVLDDGWFGKRNSDNCSLGDWVVNKNKLPSGLNSLVKDINKKGLSFGLWFEPEMLSKDSELYRIHPDWCLHVEGREASNGKYQRNQLVLDLTRAEVCEYIIEAVSNILRSAPIKYVKWDMNRPLTEIGSPSLEAKRQRETAHRYVLGLYKIMNEITSNFNDILFEGCASGGGRFDGGILYYMPQIWTSDDTDAVERLKIQYGTSIVYPAITMGAHISACPNHQVGRKVDLISRGHSAMAGNLGYELDLTKFTREEENIVKRQIKSYKEMRTLIQFGELYRLISPFDGNEAAWMFIDKEKANAVVTYFKVLGEPLTISKRLKLQGLIPNSKYKIEDEFVAYGDQLMNIGLNLDILNGDFKSKMWKLKIID